MTKKTTVQADPFLSLPAPSESHTVKIGAILATLHAAIIDAYTSDNGDKGEALKIITSNGRPSFTLDFQSAADTCLVASKVYDKGLDARKAAKDAADRQIVMDASEPQQAIARRRNATIAAMSEEERDGIDVPSTVNVPFTSLQNKLDYVDNKLGDVDLATRLSELGFDEMFFRDVENDKGEVSRTWFVRVPFNPTPVIARKTWSDQKKST